MLVRIFVVSLSFIILIGFGDRSRLEASEKKKIIRVAVASNFIEPAKALAKNFRNKSGIQVQLSFGSSGKLATQVMQGAPFDVMMSADVVTVKELVEKGFANVESMRVYAEGRLAIVSHSNGTDLDQIQDKHSLKIAIANPKLAPYGRAAVEVLNIENWQSSPLPKRFIVAENIGQAFHFFASGGVDIALVAWSQVNSKPELVPHYYLISVAKHSPIKQAIVLLKGASNAESAKMWHEFVLSNEGQELIRKHGYTTDQ